MVNLNELSLKILYHKRRIIVIHRANSKIFSYIPRTNLKKTSSIYRISVKMGPERRRMTGIMKINPYCSRYIFRSSLIGRTANKSFDPSRGGIGTRLKIASRMLI